LISRLDAEHISTHGLEQLTFEVFAHHVGLIVAKILTVWSLHITNGKRFTNRGQISFVIVDARGELRLASSGLFNCRCSGRGVGSRQCRILLFVDDFIANLVSVD